MMVLQYIQLGLWMKLWTDLPHFKFNFYLKGWFFWNVRGKLNHIECEDTLIFMNKVNNSIQNLPEISRPHYLMENTKGFFLAWSNNVYFSSYSFDHPVS